MADAVVYSALGREFGGERDACDYFGAAMALKTGDSAGIAPYRP